MLSYYPWWIVVLYRIREFLVNILGLVKHEKPDVLPSIKPENLAFDFGEKASFFTVRGAKENIYWVSETPEDKHLKAYFGVVAEELSNRLIRFHVFTSVKYILFNALLVTFCVCVYPRACRNVSTCPSSTPKTNPSPVYRLARSMRTISPRFWAAVKAELYT